MPHRDLIEDLSSAFVIVMPRQKLTCKKTVGIRKDFRYEHMQFSELKQTLHETREKYARGIGWLALVWMQSMVLLLVGCQFK